MSSYRQLLYHIVFRTKDNLHSINQEFAGQLYSYINGIVRNKNCHLYRVNGMEDHLHLLTDVHPSLALADFMRELKVATSMWMKSNGLFPAFTGWADGYGAFTCSYLDAGRVIEYIKSQQEHHSKVAFEEEYRKLLMESGIKIDDRYFP
jgi:putative transposase